MMTTMIVIVIILIIIMGLSLPENFGAKRGVYQPNVRYVPFTDALFQWLRETSYLSEWW